MLFIKSLLLGVGLSMDAVAISMANGLKNPQMKEERKLSIAFSFGFFQFFMPILGFFLVKSFAGFAPIVMKYVSVISTLILCYLGARMILSGYRKKKNKETEETEGNLLFQAVGPRSMPYLWALPFRKILSREYFFPP